MSMNRSRKCLVLLSNTGLVPDKGKRETILGTNVGNIAFHRVLEKAGFTKEGILRKALFVRGKWTDGFMYGILREEWKSSRRSSR